MDKCSPFYQFWNCPLDVRSVMPSGGLLKLTRSQMEVILAYLFCFVSILMANTSDESYILLTEKQFSKYDRRQAEEYCTQLDLRLCSLPQVVYAFEYGYRNLDYGAYYDEETEEIAKTRASSCPYLPGQECYHAGRAVPTAPLTEGELVGAYCCFVVSLVDDDAPFNVFLNRKYNHDLVLRLLENVKEERARIGKRHLE